MALRLAHPPGGKGGGAAEAEALAVLHDASTLLHPRPRRVARVGAELGRLLRRQ